MDALNDPHAEREDVIQYLRDEVAAGMPHIAVATAEPFAHLARVGSAARTAHPFLLPVRCHQRQ